MSDTKLYSAILAHITNSRRFLTHGEIVERVLDHKTFAGLGVVDVSDAIEVLRELGFLIPVRGVAEGDEVRYGRRF